MFYKHFPNSCWPFPADSQVWIVSFARTKDFFSPSAVMELILGDSSKYSDFPSVQLSHWVSHYILSSVVVGVSVNKNSHRGCLCSFTLFSNITFHSVSTVMDQAVPLLTEPPSPSILSCLAVLILCIFQCLLQLTRAPFPMKYDLFLGLVE